MWTQLVLLTILAAHQFLSGVMITGQARNTTIREDSNRLISLLRSSDEEVRQGAKKGLIELGPESVSPLLIALRELLERPGPRFELGKEADGIEIYRRMQSAYAEGNERTFEEAFKRLFPIDISARLRRDIVDLLVSLRAKEAIPMLVKFIWGGGIEFVSLGKIYLSPEAHALTRMGSIAVPQIIEVLERAEVIADSLQISDRSLTRIEKDQFTKQRARTIQIRSVLLLEEIADSQCLPVLRRLEEESEDQFLLSYVRHAINAIESIPQKRTN